MLREKLLQGSKRKKEGENGFRTHSHIDKYKEMNGYSEEDIRNAMLYQEQMKKAQEEQTALTLKLAGLLALGLWAIPTAVHFVKKSLA